MAETMRAWAVQRPGPVAGGPLVQDARPVPAPAADEVLLRVDACGLCRTDLHLAEATSPPGHPASYPATRWWDASSTAGPARPGSHRATGSGSPGCGAPAARARGVAGARRTWCPDSEYTGWDADGGFAEYAVVPAAYAYRLPDQIDDERVAPLLCAGIIGYRALRRAELPPGGRLGILGFGSSAHITAQIALAQGAEVHVMTRGEEARALALSLGAAWAGGPHDAPPVALDSAIVFAPAGDLVPVALRALRRGGTLALAGIHMSTIPALDYDRDLFLERSIRSVTANTRADGEELLALAARLPLTVHTSAYGFGEVDRALGDLAAGRVTGSVVVTGYPRGSGTR